MPPVLHNNQNKNPYSAVVAYIKSWLITSWKTNMWDDPANP